MSYVPVHERVHPPPYPLYAMSDGEPSRKRRRDSPAHSDDEPDGRHAQPTPPGAAPGGPGPASEGDAGPSIAPSIFGIAPRNEVTRVVGDFIMRFGRGREHLEIELKLGTVCAHGPERRRVRLPALSETLLPPDFPTSFSSTMSKAQHASINALLNAAVADSRGGVRFSRERNVDSLYNSPEHGEKVRVSRDRAGRPVATIIKTRLADLNVHSPAEAFDWRISLSTEAPVQFSDEGKTPVTTRDKDRAVYSGDTCRVDLTVVTTKAGAKPPATSYELEIEVLDAPALIAEGEKEERGEPNVFDDVLQSVLDTARMIIRNT